VLDQYLRARGLTPEQFTATLLDAVLRRLEDPLGRLAGVIESGPDDLAVHHDGYIGQSVQGA